LPYWLETDAFADDPIWQVLGAGKADVEDRLQAAYCRLKAKTSHLRDNGYLTTATALTQCRGRRQVLDLLCTPVLERPPLLHRQGDTCPCLGGEWIEGFGYRVHEFLKRNPSRAEHDRATAQRADLRNARLKALVYERDRSGPSTTPPSWPAQPMPTPTRSPTDHRPITNETLILSVIRTLIRAVILRVIRTVATTAPPCLKPATSRHNSTTITHTESLTSLSVRVGSGIAVMVIGVVVTPSRNALARIPTSTTGGPVPHRTCPSTCGHRAVPANAQPHPCGRTDLGR
jgi:hypothetical protein